MHPSSSCSRRAECQVGWRHHHHHHLSLTTHWPLCSGGASLSLRKSNVTRNHCQFKEKQKRINTWRMHKPTWLFQEYLIRLSEAESDTTYLIRLRSHRDLTPRIPRELFWTHGHTAGGFWGQRSGTGLISFLLYLLVDRVSCFLLLLAFRYFLLGSSGCLRRVIYLRFIFQQRRTENALIFFSF